MFKSSPKAFVACFTIAAILPIFSLIGFNIIIDPYGIFNIVAIERINKYKPLVAHHMRLAKAHTIHTYKPSAVVFGSSRAEVSINPAHPGFAAAGYKAYSMAMAGSGIYEIQQYLKHSYYASGKNLKLAIIGLDFLMFNTNREKIVFGTEVLGYEEDRLILSDSDSYYKSLKFDFDSLFLFKALRSSVNTVREQKSNELYLPNGMRHPTRNMMATTMPNIGHRNVFLHNEEYYMQKLWTTGAEQRFCPYCLDTNISTFDTFREIVKFSRDNNIELRFFTSPTHARLLIALKESGLWEELEEYKRNIVNILEDDNKLHAKQKEFVLIDFMNFNSVTTEQVPEIYDRDTQMQWHWEMSHYKIATGDLVLNRILNFDDNKHHTPIDFGTRLTATNIDAHLEKLLMDSEQYIKHFPKYYNEIHSMAEKIFNTRSGSRCSKAYKTYYEANLLRESGNEELAIQKLIHAVKLQKDEELYHKNHGLPYREKGLKKLIQLALSGKKMERALPSWMAYQDRANIKIKDGDSKGAILDLTEAIQRGPENSALLYLRAIEKDKIGDHIGAIEDFKHILDTDPSNITVIQLIKKCETDILAQK